MSGSRSATAVFTAAAAVVALAAGLFASGAVPGTSTASASVPPTLVLPNPGEGSSSHAKTATRTIRVILPSLYELAPLPTGIPVGSRLADVSTAESASVAEPSPLARKGDFLGHALPGFAARPDRTIVFTASIEADRTIAFQAAQ